MKIDNVIAVAFRLFIVYFTLWIFYQTLMLGVSWLVAGQIADGAWVYIMGVTVTLAVLYGLWIVSERVAAKIVPLGTRELTFGPLNAADLMTFGFAMMGVWISIDGLLQIVQLALQSAVSPVANMMFVFGLYALKFLIGFILALGARKLALRLAQG